MTIKERITEDMKSAMRAHDTARLSALRLLLAAIKQREVDDRVEATDELVTGRHWQAYQAAPRLREAVYGCRPR